MGQAACAQSDQEGEPDPTNLEGVHLGRTVEVPRLAARSLKDGLRSRIVLLLQRLELVRSHTEELLAGLIERSDPRLAGVVDRRDREDVALWGGGGVVQAASQLERSI